MTKDQYEAIARNIARMEEDLAQLRALLNPEWKAPSMVIMVTSNFGYDVQVDGQGLGMDVTWNVARDIAEAIAKHRPQTDERGFSKRPR